MNKLSDDSDDQETEIEKLKTELRNVTRKYKAENKKLQDDIEDKDEEIDVLKRELKKIQKQKSRKGNSDDETSLDSVGVELQKTKEELNSTREELKFKDEIISDKEEDIKSSKIQIKALENNIEELKESVDSKIEELNTKDIRLKEMEYKFNNYETQVQELEGNINQLKTHKMELTKTLGEKYEELNKKNFALQNIIKKVDQKDAAIRELDKTVAQQINDLNVYRKALQVEKDENKNLKQVSNFEQKFKAMEDEINHIKLWKFEVQSNQPSHKSKKSLLNDINKRTRNEFDSLDDCISFIKKFSNNSRKKRENDSDQDENRDKVKQLKEEIEELNDKIIDLKNKTKSIKKEFNDQLKSKDEEIEKLEEKLRLAIKKKSRNSNENSLSRSGSDRSIGESSQKSKNSLLNDINKRTGKEFDSLDDCISFIKKLSNNTDKKERKNLDQDENFAMSTDGDKVKQFVIKIEKLNDKIYELETSNKSIENKFKKQLKLKDQEIEDLQEECKSVKTQKSQDSKGRLV